jgi:hypothetical protein
VNWSVLVIVTLLAYGLAAGEFPAAAPRRPVAEYVVAAVVTAVAYTGSLLAHELAHSLVARRDGLEVEGITLWLLGGVSRLRGEVRKPRGSPSPSATRGEDRGGHAQFQGSHRRSRPSFEPRHGEAPARWHVVRKPSPARGRQAEVKSQPTGTSQRYEPGSPPSGPGPQRLPTIGRDCAPGPKLRADYLT